MTASSTTSTLRPWLADVLAHINDHNIQALDQLPPWNWKDNQTKLAACVADRAGQT
jgi:hypothetical protein